MPRANCQKYPGQIAGEVLHVVAKRLRQLEVLVDIEFLHAGSNQHRGDRPMLVEGEDDCVGEPAMRLERDEGRGHDALEDVHAGSI